MDLAKRQGDARAQAARPVAPAKPAAAAPAQAGQVDAFLVIAREMERTLSQARARSQDLEAQVGRVRMEYEEKIRRAAIARTEEDAERERLKSATAMLQARAESARLEARGYLDEIQRLKTKLVEAENALKTLQTKEGDRARAMDQFRAMNTRLASTIEKYNELVVKLKEARAEGDRAREEARQSKLKIEEIQAWAQAGRKEVELERARRGSMDGEIARLRAELDAAKKEIAAGRASIAQLQTSHKQFATSQEELQKTIRQDAIRNAQAWKDALKAELMRKAQIERELLALRAATAPSQTAQSPKKTIQPPPFRHPKPIANA